MARPTVDQLGPVPKGLINLDKYVQNIVTFQKTGTLLFVTVYIFLFTKYRKHGELDVLSYTALGQNLLTSETMYVFRMIKASQSQT